MEVCSSPSSGFSLSSIVVFFPSFFVEVQLSPPVFFFMVPSHSLSIILTVITTISLSRSVTVTSEKKNSQSIIQSTDWLWSTWWSSSTFFGMQQRYVRNLNSTTTHQVRKYFSRSNVWWCKFISLSLKALVWNDSPSTFRFHPPVTLPVSLNSQQQATTKQRTTTNNTKKASKQGI